MVKAVSAADDALAAANSSSSARRASASSSAALLRLPLPAIRTRRAALALPARRPAPLVGVVLRDAAPAGGDTGVLAPAAPAYGAAATGATMAVGGAAMVAAAVS